MFEWTGRTRWVVHYHPKDCADDWDLLRYCQKAYFNSKGDATEFAETHKFKGKPFYWQPHIYKEHEKRVTQYSWTCRR